MSRKITLASLVLVGAVAVVQTATAAPIRVLLPTIAPVTAKIAPVTHPIFVPAPIFISPPASTEPANSSEP